jgi:hypothetical protein
MHGGLFTNRKYKQGRKGGLAREKQAPTEMRGDKIDGPGHPVAPLHVTLVFWKNAQLARLVST